MLTFTIDRELAEKQYPRLGKQEIYTIQISTDEPEKIDIILEALGNRPVNQPVQSTATSTQRRCALFERISARKRKRKKVT